MLDDRRAACGVCRAFRRRFTLISSIPDSLRMVDYPSHTGMKLGKA
jgi:hypothetical protein